MKNLSLIAAVGSDWGLGKDGELLFSIKEDMQFFRRTTTGNVVVMGRKTLESFPNQKPLKNRVNIVLTKNKNYKAEGAVVVNSTKELFSELEKYADRELFCIGGGEIYALLLPYCETAYITKVNAEKEADTFLENLDKAPSWELLECGEVQKNENYTFSFCKYVKKA